jgi:hypothetical protein
LRLGKLVEYFALSSGTATFKPHVTLVSGFNDAPEILMKKMKILAGNYKSPMIKFLSIKTKPKYFQAFFLKCERTDALMELNLEAQKLFNHRYGYEPHLSLMYGNVKNTEKKLLLQKLPAISLPSLSFKAAKISLWHAKGRVQDWVLIKQEKFGKV